MLMLEADAPSLHLATRHEEAAESCLLRARTCHLTRPVVHAGTTSLQLLTCLVAQTQLRHMCAAVVARGSGMRHWRMNPNPNPNPSPNPNPNPNPNFHPNLDTNSNPNPDPDPLFIRCPTVRRALFASAWQQRDAALRHVAAAAQAGPGGGFTAAADAASQGGPAELWRSVVPALSRSVADKVAVVATSALQV